VRIFDKLFGREPSDPADDVIDWLANKSIDDRRFVAGILYGGPHSLKVVKWVLSQPDCDKGTAAMLLWEFGMPYAIIRNDRSAPVIVDVARELLDFITDRWRKGLFTELVFSFDPREQAKIYRRELKKKGLQGTDPLNIPEEAWKPIEGRKPTRGDPDALKAGPFMDGALNALRLADMAVIKPEVWEPIRRRSLGLD
jgi:hypothetical protein